MTSHISTFIYPRTWHASSQTFRNWPFQVELQTKLPGKRTLRSRKQCHNLTKIPSGNTLNVHLIEVSHNKLAWFWCLRPLNRAVRWIQVCLIVNYYNLKFRDLSWHLLSKGCPLNNGSASYRFHCKTFPNTNR